MREHWEEIYREREPGHVSWYAPHLEVSLRVIGEVAPPPARLIDVGGGASTLVDDLLARGYPTPTVLDIAEAALQRARERLGERAARVIWRCADVTRADLPAAAYDLWHDRAVFHFMTSAADRAAYVVRLRHALAPDGFALIATFAPDGPERCSGLQVVRYDGPSLLDALGPGFALRTTEHSLHTTPQGKAQAFNFHLLQRTPG